MLRRERIQNEAFIILTAHLAGFALFTIWDVY